MMTSAAHKQLWGVVEGAVNDAFHKHDDYLTPKGRRNAKVSVIKRVTGTVLGFALQEAQRQRKLAAEPEAIASSPVATGGPTSEAGDGASVRHPLDPHCRIVNVRLKRRSRYRSPASFNLTTSKLLRSLQSLPSYGKGK